MRPGIAIAAAVLASLTLTAGAAESDIDAEREYTTAAAYFPSRFEAGDFARIESEAEKIRQRGGMTAEGYLYEDYYLSFETFPHCTQRGQSAGEFVAACEAKVLPRLDEWQRAFPDSPYPAIGRAKMLLFAAQSNPNDADKRQGFLDKAWQQLQGVPRGKRPAVWYEIALGITTEAGWPERRFFELVTQAFDTAPRLRVVRAAVRYALPRNGGSLTLLRRLSNVALPYQDNVGVSLYVHFAEAARSEGINLYRDGVADWSIARAGLMKRAQQRPHDANWYNLGTHACWAFDYATLEMAMTRTPRLKTYLDGSRNCRVGLENWRKYQQEPEERPPKA